MRNTISILTIVTILSTFSCKKYPEGSALSLQSTSARVTNNWVCEQVLVNNQESTGFYSDYNYTYEEGKSYSESNGYNTLNGTWQLVSNDDSLIVKLNSNQVLHRYKILKLKKNSMWLTEKINSSTYEWHMETK